MLMQAKNVEIGKFMVCFYIDIMEKQPISFQKWKID